MKWFITLFIYFLCGSMLLIGQTNPKHTYVKAYYRKDGTYVQGHYKTTSNSTNRDNFSTKGNVNPYTGQPGWINPDNKGAYSSGKSGYNYSNSNSSFLKYAGTINSLGQKVINYTNGREVFGLCKYCLDSFIMKNLIIIGIHLIQEFKKLKVVLEEYY